MKMNKILIGLVAAGVLGAGLTVMASTNDGTYNKTVEVKPVNTVAGQSNYTVGNITSTDIEQYIVSKYGENWASDLYAKNGYMWDDILENELEMHFGKKYDELIDNVVDTKEYELGLDDYDDIYDDDSRTYTADAVSKRDEIEKAIVAKYGSNWATDLAAKNGSNWDDILENELDKQYGIKYDDIIEDIIEAKEYELGLDFDNDHYDFDDDYDDYDFDDHYDND